MQRRRFLRLAAASSSTALASLAHGAMAQQNPTGKIAPLAWKGRLLGADSSLALYHENAVVAQRALSAVLARVRALEGLFSLHRADSALSRLNAHSALADAPAPLLELLHYSQALNAATDGAFDPSVQPLFALYADHFAKPDADPEGPSQEALAAALACTGFSGVRFGHGGVRFAQTGMALTLNGIAQGYITDQATAVLRQHGLSHCLVNFGEYRALNTHPSGRPWVIGLAAPEAPWTLMESVNLRNGAIATSAGAGTRFDAAGRFNHLIDPRSGRSAVAIASVSVTAPSATLADALSTALAVSSQDQVTLIMQRFAQAGALLRWRNGRSTRIRFAG